MQPLNTVVIHPLATREYRKACQRYGQYSSQTEDRFRADIRRVIDRIEENPLQGSIYSTVDYCLKARRYPYVVYYRKLAIHHWLVVAIAHGRRRPGYWRKRQ